MGRKDTEVFEISFMTHGTIIKINRRGGDLFGKFDLPSFFFHQCSFEADCDFRQLHVTGAELGKEWQ